MSAALLILRRCAPYIITTALIFSALFLAYRHGVNVTTDRYELQIAKTNKELLKESARLQAVARDAEQAAAKRVAAADELLIKGIRNETIKRDRIIADLRAGNVRLRNEIAGCTAAGSVPTSNASSSGSDGAARCGLSAAHAEFLIQLAAEADYVALQLHACQEIIKSDRVN